ncbi:MAG: hypothetical protein IPJ88_14805 [Myxococcales bacterium]|nr:MAG: hypothetical protein IPJ88_14805 [Myxococcales bacterium]
MIALSPLLIAFMFCIAALLVRRQPDAKKARAFSVIATGLGFFVSLVFLGIEQFFPQAELSAAAHQVVLLPPGLLSFAPTVNCVIGMLAVSLSSVATHRSRSYANILALLLVSLTFVALTDPMALFFLWAFSAWIVYSELRESNRTHKSAQLFLIYHIPSIVLFGIGAWLHSEQVTTLSMICLVLAIVIREAVIPLHSWFPLFVSQAPMGIVVAFVAPQIGVYAHLTLLSESLPSSFAHHIATVGAITSIAAATLAIVQKDAKRALAFLMMSQTGLVAFGLENESSVGYFGALLTWQVLALASSGFAMSLSALEARRGQLSLNAPGGNFSRTPHLATAFLLLGFATVGFPLTIGFIAEDLLVQGSVAEYPLLGISLIIATALNGMTVMRAFFVLFSGSNTHIGEQDLCLRERIALSVVLAVLLITGIQPRLLLSFEAQALPEQPPVQQTK